MKELKGFSPDYKPKTRIMSYVKVMIHSVWGTKNRERVLLPETRKLLLDHIKENAKEKGIYIDTINAEPDHVHCLFGLNADMTLSKAMQLMKGEASFWANQQKLIRPKLIWAVDYYAGSVSELQLPMVRAYIRNQHEHHRRQSFAEEYEEFMKAHQG